MPYAIRRPMPGRPAVKEWYMMDKDGDGYEEIVKYVTEAEAVSAGADWAGDDAEVVQVQWTAGDDPDEQ